VTQYAPNPAQQSAAKPSNGLGLTGFVLGLVGLVLSFIPLIGVVAWPLVILGVIFSAIGISKAVKGRATNKGMAITGLVLSVIGIVICILQAAVWGAAVNEANDALNTDVKIVYEVTGDAANVNVTYMEFKDGTDVAPTDETVAALPWTKEITAKDYIKEGGAVIVTTGAEGGSVTCKLTVDGKEVATETVSGAFQMVTCDQL
jgi:hypothetical protein